MSVAPVQAAAVTSPEGPDAPARELQRAAMQFERMLLRTMLSQLEKSIHPGGSGSSPAGGSLYSSMIVDALADSIANAGGIGLADKVAQNMQEHLGDP